MSLTLGQVVTWSSGNELHREYVRGDWYARVPSRKEWRTGYHFAQERTGVVVGLRTLANGVVELGTYDSPTTFYADERFPAVLLSYDLRRKPVLVKPEHVHPTEES